MINNTNIYIMCETCEKALDDMFGEPRYEIYTSSTDEQSERHDTS